MAKTDPSTSRPTEAQSKPKPSPPHNRGAEGDLDTLIYQLHSRQGGTSGQSSTLKLDSVDALRDRTLREFIPLFLELADKYAKSGIVMRIDASNFLQGGREIKMEFALGAYRTILEGTVTNDAIAFQEIRHAPDSMGELASGPLLRIRRLDRDMFREFVCEQLAALLRSSMRRR